LGKRKKRGWSQEDFAYRANIDRSYMGGVERDERNLSFKKVCAIEFQMTLLASSGEQVMCATLGK